MAFELRDSGQLEKHEETELKKSLDWLKMHLKSPDCLQEECNHRAISWFHPRALKPLKHMWNIVQILEDHNILVKVHKTDEPGIVIYEDGWQVVAKPKRKK